MSAPQAIAAQTLSSTSPPTKVAVVPPTSAFACNALFEGRREDQSAHTPNAHWMDGFAEVHKLAKSLNIQMATHDVLPMADADIMIHMAVPNFPWDILDLKRKNGRLKAILVLLETALGASYTFNRMNHQGFDAIITYDERLVDNQRYFHMGPRAYYRERIRRGPSFGDRKLGCLVGTNRPLRYRTGVVAMKKGWHFSWHDWWDYVFCPGQLITYRSEFGRLCARHDSGAFDIYGEGWDVYPETRERCRGIPKESTLDYLGNYRYYMAFENQAGEHSLISERIWDALWGDSVPVYYGNTRLNRYLPRECFVDAAAFEGPEELLDWLARSTEREWATYRQAGRDFLQSSRAEAVLPPAFAESFLRPIAALAGRLA